MVLEEYNFFCGNSHRFVVHVHGFFFNGTVIFILNEERILQKMNYFFIALDVNCKYFNI